MFASAWLAAADPSGSLCPCFVRRGTVVKSLLQKSVKCSARSPKHHASGALAVEALVFDLEDAIAAAKTPGDMAKSDVRWRGRSSVPTLTQYSQAIPELLSWWRTPSRLENKTRHLSSVDILFLRFCIAHRSFPPCWLTPRWICIASACGMRLLRHCQQANNKSNVRFCRSYTPEEVCLHFFVEHLKSSGVLLLRCACGRSRVL